MDFILPPHGVGEDHVKNAFQVITKNQTKGKGEMNTTKHISKNKEEKEEKLDEKETGKILIPKRGDSYIMPYGKHRGKPIHTIPSNYLKWVAENWNEKDVMKKRIVEECDKEYQFREKYNCHIKED